MEKLLENEMTDLLRRKGVITSSEVVYEVGDLYVAENVINKNRRLIENADLHLVEGKKILKG
ncbi:hypothetical protein OAA09_00520 [bacterium]|nr:hypothetical protein [bacterium]